MLQLSARDLAGLNRVSHVLLSPLDHADVDAWRALVNHELSALLGADSAGFLLPTVDAAPMFSSEHSRELLAAFPDLLPPPLSDGTPIWHRMREMGTGTLDMMYGTDMPIYLASAYYNEFAAKGGGAETIASTVLVSGSGDTPVGMASLHLWHARLGRRRFGDREVALLTLLFPAFRAGVESWQRFGAYRTSLLNTLDRLDQAVVMCDHAGRVAHETPGVARELADDPDHDIVRSAITSLAHLMPARSAEPDAPRVWQEIRTPLARYTIHICLHTTGAGDIPVRLVVLKRETPRPRSTDDLRAEFRFTPTEAFVARLIGRGLRSAAIAASLGMSVHTVKRHTEHVMQKLEVSSRAEVGPRIA